MLAVIIRRKVGKIVSMMISIPVVGGSCCMILATMLLMKVRRLM